jgi:hypothetical protein
MSHGVIHAINFFEGKALPKLVETTEGNANWRVVRRMAGRANSALSWNECGTKREALWVSAHIGCGNAAGHRNPGACALGAVGCRQEAETLSDVHGKSDSFIVVIARHKIAWNGAKHASKSQEACAVGW